jgi:hypothetical protein
MGAKHNRNIGVAGLIERCLREDNSPIRQRNRVRVRCDNAYVEKEPPTYYVRIAENFYAKYKVQSGAIRQDYQVNNLRFGCALANAVSV